MLDPQHSCENQSADDNVLYDEEGPKSGKGQKRSEVRD